MVLDQSPDIVIDRLPAFKGRNVIERAFSRVKMWRRVETRCSC